MHVKTRKLFVRFGSVVGMLACVGLSSLMPVARAADDELVEIKKQIQGLQEGQAALLKEIQALKKLMTPTPKGPVTDVSFVMDLGDNPKIKGDKNAKVILVEVSDFQCPFCSRFGKQAGAQIDKDYIDTGKIQHAFVDLPLGFHQHAQKAAEAAECAAEQGKFWEMHDRLFANQAKISTNDLPSHAEAVGLDVAKFKDCVTSGKFAADVKRDSMEAAKAGITGTPTFVVGVRDGNKVKAVKLVRGAQTFENFKLAIDAVLTAQK